MSNVGVECDYGIIMHYSFYVFSKTDEIYYNTQSDYLISTFEKFAIFPLLEMNIVVWAILKFYQKSLVTLNWKNKVKKTNECICS